jgi:hypothetical protein
MDSSTVTVIVITLVLVLSIAAAILAYVVDSGDWNRRLDSSDLEDHADSVNRVVRGLNDAIQGGYKYDMGQDEDIEENSDSIEASQTKIAALERKIDSNASKIKELEEALDESAVSEEVVGLLESLLQGELAKLAAPVSPGTNLAIPGPAPASGTSAAPAAPAAAAAASASGTAASGTTAASASR